MHMALIAHIECLFPASHLKSGSGTSRLLQLSLFLDPWFSQARLDMQSKSCSISCLSLPTWTCLEGRPDQVPTTPQLAPLWLWDNPSSSNHPSGWGSSAATCCRSLIPITFVRSHVPTVLTSGGGWWWWTCRQSSLSGNSHDWIRLWKTQAPRLKAASINRWRPSSFTPNLNVRLMTKCWLLLVQI